MTDREVMKQALDVLERVAAHLMRKQDVEVMQALRAQLEQPKGLFIDMIAAHGPEFVEEVRMVGENIEQQAEPKHMVQSNGRHSPLLTHMMNKRTSPPQRKPMTEDMVHRAMVALNTASCGDFQPTFEEMRAALEAAHGIRGAT